MLSYIHKMWNQLSGVTLLLQLAISLVAAHDVHTTYKMGKTSWGRMTHREFCPTSTYVVGFRLRVHPRQGVFKDDTALNGIQLKCSNGNHTGQLTGPQGDWGTYRQCTGGRHVTGFNLRSEGNQKVGDDAAATDVKMQCSDRKERLYGDGLSWGSWEVSGYQECPKGSYFCGVQARIEHIGLDSTGLNQLVFICCRTLAGTWGEWTSWSSCSAACNGTRKRNRKCNGPKARNNDFLCIVNGTRRNIEKQLESCHMPPCPVDGKWSNWTPWSMCTATCSSGTQTRTRHCGNPHPLHGSLNCIMGNGERSTLETEIIKCSQPPCPPPVQIRQSVSGESSTPTDVKTQDITVVIIVLIVFVIVLLSISVWRRREYQVRTRWEAGYRYINLNSVAEPSEQRELNNVAYNRTCDNNYTARNKYDIVTLEDRDFGMNDEMNMSDNQQPTASGSHQNRSGNNYSLPHFADGVNLESTKFTDLPPPYEDIEENIENVAVSSLPLYKIPQEITPTCQQEDDQDGDVSARYEEINVGLPQGDDANEEIPDHDSYGHDSVEQDNSPENKEQADNSLHRTTLTNHLNSHQDHSPENKEQADDDLHGTTFENHLNSQQDHSPENKEQADDDLHGTTLENHLNSQQESDVAAIIPLIPEDANELESKGSNGGPECITD